MKRKASFILLYAAILLLGGLGLLLLLTGEKESRVSEKENRMLAGFPKCSLETLLDGSLMSGVESYLSDGMFERDAIVDLTAAISERFSVGKKEEASLEEQVASYAEDEESPAAATEPLTTPAAEQTGASPSAEPAEEAALHTGSLWRIKTDGSRAEVYSFPVENLQNAIDVLNAYREILPENGNVFFTEVPFPGIGTSLQNGSYIGWGSDVEEILNEHTREGVFSLSTLEVLEEHLLSGEYLYFRTDHHWTPRAACYTVRAFLAVLGIPSADYGDYKYYTYNDFAGSGAQNGSSLRDTIDVLDPLLPTKSYLVGASGEKDAPFMVTGRHSYLAYLSGTLGPWRRFETGADTGRKCLVISDSYGNCFIPYLMPYYDEVHSVDLRKSYFDLASGKWTVSEYAELNGIDDIYIILSTASSLNAGYMKNLLWKYL